MAPTEDQRALLQLLLVRGRDRDSIAELLGISVEEVDQRLSVAVGAFGADSEPLPDALTRYLTGTADPITRAEAVAELDRDETLRESFGEIRDVLAASFPGASLPTGPEGSAARDEDPAAGQADTSLRPASPPASPEAPRSPRSPLDPAQRRLLFALLSAALLAGIVVAVVVLLGGSEEAETGPSGPTAAVLTPEGGERGSGEIEFGFAGERFAANLRLTGLEPNRAGQAYALWLDGPAGAFPFDRAIVGRGGEVGGQSVINEAVICFIAADLFTEVRVSRTTDAAFRRAVASAVRAGGNQAVFPDYTGKTVLSGPIAMPADSRRRIIQECGGRSPETG